jgi:hypothetical protein
VATVVRFAAAKRVDTMMVYSSGGASSVTRNRDGD